MTAGARPSIVITGVSSGIGHGCTEYLIKHGFHVFGSVRSARARERVEEAFPEHFTTLEFDVRDGAAIKKAQRTVSDVLGGQLLSALVNNAGIALGGPMQLLDDDDFRQQIEVNVLGTRLVTNAFLPLLGANPSALTTPLQKPGKIINMSSISGILNTPINGAYCVSKHAMESLGEVYRRELMQYGIDVVSIQPGPIQSEIWTKNIGAMQRYAESPYATMIENSDNLMQDAQKNAQSTDVIGRLILKILKIRSPKTSYIVHTNTTLVALLAKYLPARWVDNILRRRLNT